MLLEVLLLEFTHLPIYMVSLMNHAFSMKELILNRLVKTLMFVKTVSNLLLFSMRLAERDVSLLLTINDIMPRNMELSQALKQ